MATTGKLIFKDDPDFTKRGVYLNGDIIATDTSDQFVRYVTELWDDENTWRHCYITKTGDTCKVGINYWGDEAVDLADSPYDICMPAYIDIQSNEMLKISWFLFEMPRRGIGRIAWYDADKVFISADIPCTFGTQTDPSTDEHKRSFNGTVIPAEGARYFRMGFIVPDADDPESYVISVHRMIQQGQ